MDLYFLCLTEVERLIEQFIEIAKFPVSQPMLGMRQQDHEQTGRQLCLRGEVARDLKERKQLYKSDHKIMVLKSLLGLFDRLSTKSTLIGETGSLLGLAGTVAFLVLALIVYLRTTIDYSNGAFYQSEFQISNSSKNESFSSGRDFRIALVFKSKSNDSVYNHSDILAKMQVLYTHILPLNTYYSQMKPCQADYFQQNVVNPITLQDCLIIPSNALFDVKGNLQIYLKDKCEDPFGCRSGVTLTDTPLTQLLTDNFYELYFTSTELDRLGNTKFRLHKVNSFEYFTGEEISSSLTIYYTVKHTTLDDSVMPWRNHRTLTELQWDGYLTGNIADSGQASNYGIHIRASIRPYEAFEYRYYKKLDYLFGIVGGGTFLFFLIFWIPCTYVNRTWQKIQNANRLLLEANQVPYQNLGHLNPVRISWLYIFCFLCYRKSKEPKIIKKAEQKLNIVNMLKRVKVAQRNLQTNNINPHFERRDLDFEEPHELPMGLESSGSTVLTEIPLNQYTSLKQDKETDNIYQNNPYMLAITQKSQKLEQIFEDETLDKVNTNISVRRTCLFHIKNVTAQFLKFCDVFGASPNFITAPENSSCWGLLVTLVILTLSIITVVGTVTLMNKNQVFITYDQVTGEKASVEMITGPSSEDNKFQLLVCFHINALNYGYIQGIGANRTAQVKYYTNESFQNGTFQYIEYDLQHLDATYVADPILNLTDIIPYCRKIPDGVRLKAIGSPLQRRQAYFGLVFKPYCFGTPQECLLRQNDTNNKFISFIRQYAKSLMLPINKYNPREDRMTRSVTVNTLTEANSQGNQTANTAIEQTLYADEINVLDDGSTWLVRQPPIKLIEQLTFGETSQREYGNTIVGTEPYYRVLIRPSGKIQSVIKRGYKIDYLFGIFGGVFIFYYFIFQWTARAYNAFKTRAKLAEIHFREQMYDESPFNICCHLSHLPLYCIPNCCNTRSDVQRMQLTDSKMKRDLFYLNLVKTVENCWRLSASFFPTIVYKDISLLYLKEKIDEKERVHLRNRQVQLDVVKDHQELEEDQYQIDDQLMDGRMKVANSSMADINQVPESSMGKIADQKLVGHNYDKETVHSQTYEPPLTIVDILTWFDSFNVKAELTYNGERRVKSVFGGLTCLVLSLLIILVVAHFVGINLSRSDYTVGLQDRATKQGEDFILLNQSNFRFMYTFYKQSNYQFLDISSFLQHLGMDIVQLTYERTAQSTNVTVVRTPFEPCARNYLDGYIDEFTNPGYYSSIRNGFCVPRNLSLQISGGHGSRFTKHFYFDVYDKTNTTDSFSSISNFFLNYYSMYHISAPVRNFQSTKLKYNMLPLISQVYLANKSSQYNISLMKYKVNLEDNFVGSAITHDTYAYENYQIYDFSKKTELVRGNAYRRLYFNFNNRIAEYTVDIPGTRQIFGLIGGVIVMFIFGFSCCASSFNEYRMRYLVGKELYTFGIKSDPSLPKSKPDANMNSVNNYSQFTVMIAWLFSPIAYVRNNYNSYDFLRHITLIQSRIEEDLDIYKFSRKLASVERELNKAKKLPSHPQIKLTRVYPKEVYIPNAEPYTSDEFYMVAKNHKLTSFEQRKLQRAKDSNVDIKKVFSGKYLIKSFSDECSEMDSSVVNRIMNKERPPSREENFYNSTANNNHNHTGPQYNDPGDSQLRESQQNKIVLEQVEG